MKQFFMNNWIIKELGYSITVVLIFGSFIDFRSYVCIKVQLGIKVNLVKQAVWCCWTQMKWCVQRLKICFGNYAIVCNGTSSVSFQLCHLLVCILKIGVFDNIKAFIMVTMVLVKLFCISFHQVFGHQYKSVPKLQSILIH